MKANGERKWGTGLLLILLGAAGIAENITSGRGSFMFCAVVFSIGFGLVLWSYMR